MRPASLDRPKGGKPSPTPEAAPGIFAKEFEDLVSLVAQNVSVEIRPSEEVQVLGILKVNDAILAGLADMTRNRFIVAGDWNTGREQGSAARDRVGAEFFDRAGERGWHDCSFEHGDGRELRTWYGDGDIVQDDHVFADASLAASVRSVWVANEPAERLGLSDHAPLIVDVQVPPISMTSLGEANGPNQEAIA